MAYIKLDKSIITSSLWLDSDTTLLFITALLLAEPCEVLEPTPQLNVDALEETGFIVQPGWYGMVEASGPRLVEIAKIPVDPGMKALRALGDTDTHSRSQEFGGRRLVRVRHGFLVLNYIRYREKDHTAAERMRRFRERKAEANKPQPRAPRRQTERERVAMLARVGQYIPPPEEKLN